ncbi:diguanylate cyclase [Amphritea sp.]|uniref:diguanylate cyclase n=1 Tax=Amphritea sp. TaxID=1872502 RepID=UPI003A939AC2
MNKISVANLDDVYRIEALIDLPSFAEILEGYYQATGIPNSLMGPTGEVLTKAGWTDACSNFHRTHEASSRCCNDSDSGLLKQAEQQLSYSLCKNGLYDYAMPIIIEDRKIATLYMGQLLHSAPDRHQFEQQAEAYGFDKEAYLTAIQQIPVIPRERVEKQLRHMAQVTTVLANSALSSMREQRLQKALKQSKKQRIEITDLLDNSPTGISWCDAQGTIEYVNHTFVRMFGYTLEDLPNTKAWHEKAYPDLKYREEYELNWKQWFQAQTQTDTRTHSDTSLYTVESAVHCKDGSIKRISAQVSLVNNKHLYNCTDITEKWRSEQRNITQNKMLRRVTQGEELNDIMYQLITDIESDAPDNLCSILLLDAEGKHLLSCAAPSLPAFYSDAINGIEIGEGVGSCGTATFLGLRVIVEDISTHRYWTPYRELASSAGLGSCWSEPIISSKGKVLGSFAIYHATPSTPDDDDIERISFAANLAALAIENLHNHEELSRRELAYRSLAENAPDAIARYDQHAKLIYTNPNFDALFTFTYIPTADNSFLESYHSVIRRVIGNGVPQQVEIKIPTGSSQRYLMFSIVAEEHETGTGALAIGRDVTLHHEMEQKLEKQARSDFLTQLINRRYFFELANRELTIASRYHNQLSLIMFDLDHFKQVNDTYGHAIGDLVLQRVAAISQSTLREADILARLGGEEFVVLLIQSSTEAAAQTAERLRQGIESLSIALDSEITISVTASFGVTTVNFESDHNVSHTINHIISEADSAMYSAKQKGRNRIEFA